MAEKAKFDYFDVFEKQTEVTVKEAELLIEAIEGFTEAEHLKAVMERAHELEHKGGGCAGPPEGYQGALDGEDFAEKADRYDTMIQKLILTGGQRI